MSKAIRIAIAAAFGVAATLPAFADFENNGPSDRAKQGNTSLQEVNPPALGQTTPTFDSRWDSNTRADASQFSADRPAKERHHFFSSRRDDRVTTADGYGHMAPYNQVYGGVSEPGSMSEPGMKAGEFNWDRYTARFDRDYRSGSGS